MTDEKAKEILLDIRGYYASKTVDYPKGKDTVAICGYMCSEVANACLTAVKALEDKGYEQGYADGFAECLDLNT